MSDKDLNSADITAALKKREGNSEDKYHTPDDVFGLGRLAKHLREVREKKISPRPSRIALQFPEVVLPPCERLIVEARPDVAFHGERIVAWESKPETTVVCGVFVDRVSQFPKEVMEVPTSNFALNTLHNSRALKICDAGRAIAFAVKNVTDEPVEWGAYIIGSVVK